MVPQYSARRARAMLEFVKFCYQWILPPGLVILILLLAGIFFLARRRKGWGVFFVAALLLWLCSLRIVANLVCAPLEEAILVPPMEEVAGCDLMVMTGAGSVGGVPDIGGTGQPGPIMAKSMLTAFRLQRATGLPLLVSGGQVRSENGSEADIALRIFGQMGIAKDMLIAENQSRNTAENARRTRELLQEMGLRKAVVVSPALHAPRVRLLFAREGLDVVMYPSHYRRSRDWNFHLLMDIMPTAENLNDVSDALHEYLGLLAIRLGLY